MIPSEPTPSNSRRVTLVDSTELFFFVFFFVLIVTTMLPFVVFNYENVKQMQKAENKVNLIIHVQQSLARGESLYPSSRESPPKRPKHRLF